MTIKERLTGAGWKPVPDDGRPIAYWVHREFIMGDGDPDPVEVQVAEGAAPDAIALYAGAIGSQAMWDEPDAPCRAKALGFWQEWRPPTGCEKDQEPFRLFAPLKECVRAAASLADAMRTFDASLCLKP